MLFSNQDGEKPTATLSGGEAARLVLSYLILMEFNTLVLDEPTDHLDLEAVLGAEGGDRVVRGHGLLRDPRSRRGERGDHDLDVPEDGRADQLRGHAGRVPGLAPEVLLEGVLRLAPLWFGGAMVG